MKDINDLNAVIIDLDTGAMIEAGNIVVVNLDSVPDEVVNWLDTLSDDEVIDFGEEFGDSMFADLDSLNI